MLVLKYPTLLEEQQVIAQAFSDMDDEIIQLKRKFGKVPTDQAGHDTRTAHRLDSAGIKDVENGRNCTTTSKNLRGITAKSTLGMAYLSSLGPLILTGIFVFYRV